MGKTKGIKVIVIISVVILFTYFTFYPLFYQINFSHVGIGAGHTYEAVVRNLGKPKSMQQDKEGDWIACYDGLKIVFGKEKNSILKRVSITGNQYKFGIWRVGVGTPRSKIESIYRYIPKAKEVSQNEFTVIDSGTWIWFKFDKDDRVYQIDLTAGI